jgi:hypothetical protein
LSKRGDGTRDTRIAGVGRVDTERTRQAWNVQICVRRKRIPLGLIIEISPLRLLKEQTRFGRGFRPDLLSDAAEDVAERARRGAAIININARDFSLL